VTIPASDLERAHEVIRDLRLRGPHDGPGTFTWPKEPSGRRELADLVYDLADEHAARAVLDAPTKTRTAY
jgi:hypothetical protein